MPFHPFVKTLKAFTCTNFIRHQDIKYTCILVAPIQHLFCAFYLLENEYYLDAPHKQTDCYNLSDKFGYQIQRKKKNTTENTHQIYYIILLSKIQNEKKNREKDKEETYSR